MTRARTVDIHSHILTKEAMQRLARESPRVTPAWTDRTDRSATMEIDGKVVQRPMPHEIWNLDWRLRDMDANGVDMQLICPTTQTFFYDCEPALGLSCAALQNEDIARVVKEHAGRFAGLATVPMQAPELAAQELRRAMTTLGLKGMEIGSQVRGRNLDDPALDPVWAAAEQLSAFIFIHPLAFGPRERLQSYYLNNFVGLTFETTLAGASLVFGGVLERYPDLRICLSHGGGYIPYQRGRFLHGWQVREEPKARLHGNPDTSIDRLYFDSITHSAKALEYLVDVQGADHVLLGSDYPFDMGNLDCVRKVEEAQLQPAIRERILGGRARELLKLGD